MPTHAHPLAPALILSAALLSASPLLADPLPPLPPLDSAATHFANVNVVVTDGGRAEVRRAQHVLVRNGLIESVGDAPPAGGRGEFRTVDGGGTAFLIPGLCDMHIHLPPQPADAGDPTWRTLTLLIANGVTTTRSLIGHPAHIEVRRRVHSGEVLGPTLYLAGPPLHQGTVSTPAAAEAAVRAQKDAGFDAIKSHVLTNPEAFDAGQRTAAELKIPVAGHVTNEVGLDRAISAGMQIEHLDGFIAALTDGPLPPFGQFPPPAVMDKVDEARLAPLAERMAAGGIWNTPTMALFNLVLDPATPSDELRRRESMRYIHDQALEAWTKQREGMLMAGHFANGHGERVRALRERIVRALRDADAPLMAGSDCPQNFLAPGFALHDELAALVAAGLTPADALRAATAYPARYLRALPGEGSATGIAANFGEVKPGARADLVLLAADPTADIANTRAIRGVMVRGRWLDRAELDRMLAEVAASVGKGGAPAAG